jgi:hypothetical protein
MVQKSVTDNPKLITELFNTYFLTTVEKMNTDTKSSAEKAAIQHMANTNPTIFPGVNLLPTTANEIKNIINSLKSKNACIYDETSTE